MNNDKSSQAANVLPISKDCNIVDKFRKYRMEVETKEKKFKETKIVLERLKQENNISKEVEKSLRSQICSSQSRLLLMQSTLSRMTVISGQQRENEKKCQNLQQKLEEFEKVLKESKKKTNSLYDTVSKETDLMKSNQELKSLLSKKECEFDLLKMELHLLKKEKMELQSEYQVKYKNLESELERRKTEYDEAKISYDKTLHLYKKQLEENEQIIKEYEKERKSLLEEFEPPTDTQGPDSTVQEKTNEPKRFKESEELFVCTSEPRSLTDRRFKFEKKDNKFSRPGAKQKPQLEFLSQEIFQQSPEIPKRRLFSTNSNHYVN